MLYQSMDHIELLNGFSQLCIYSMGVLREWLFIFQWGNRCSTSSESLLSHNMCTSWGVLYTIFKWNVSNDIMVMLSYTKPPRHEQVARNDGYVLMKYIPNSEDPLSYSKNRDDDQWIIISYTDWQLFCNSLW